MQILKSVGGSYSSKRTMGIVYMAVGLLLAVLDQVTKHQINNFEVWVTIVITGASLLGLSLFEYFGKVGKEGGLQIQSTVNPDPSTPPPPPKK